MGGGDDTTSNASTTRNRRRARTNERANARTNAREDGREREASTRAMHLRALAIDALGLVAPRSVAIQDWRLLISLQALRGLVAFYVLYSLINGKTYLQQEVPHGTISNIGTSTEYRWTRG